MVRRRRLHVASWVMFSPYLVLLVTFGIAPVVLAFQSSFGNSIANPDGGIDNYWLVLTDFRFLPALRNVAVFLALYLPAMLIVVTVMSILLDINHSPRNKYLRLAYIVPASITGAVAILVWYFLLEPTLSPFRDILHALGITQAGQIWRTGNLAIIFATMAFFTGAGSWILVEYGALQSISDEIVEAARLDGCNAVQLARWIKLPLIKPYLIYMLVLTFAAGVQIFVEPQLISASVYTGLAKGWSLNQLSYDLAFGSGNFGGAAALSLVLLVICVVAALLVIFKTDFFDRESYLKT
jgi:multiple sugar transport system permease protein